MDVRLRRKAEKNLKLAEEAMNSTLSKTSLSTTTDSSYSTDENMAPKSSSMSTSEYTPSVFFEPPKLVASTSLNSSGTATLTQHPNNYYTYQNTAPIFNNLGTTTLTHRPNDSSAYQTLVPSFNNLAMDTPTNRSNSYSTYQNLPPTFSSSSNAIVPSRIFSRKTSLYTSSPAPFAAPNVASRCTTGSREQSFDSSSYFAPPPPVMPPVSRPNLAFRNFQPINQSLDTSYDFDPSTVQVKRTIDTYALDLFKKKVKEIVLQNCIEYDLSIGRADVDAMVTKLCKDEFIVHHNLGGSLEHIQMTENISGRIKNRLKMSWVQENAKKRDEEDTNKKAEECAKLSYKKNAEETAKKGVHTKTHKYKNGMYQNAFS